MSFAVLRQGATEMKTKKNYIKRNIAGEYLLVPIGDTGDSSATILSLNETASDIWDIMLKAENEEEMVEMMTELYDVDTDTAKTDIEDFLNNLRNSDII
jgi:hypothetical protein